MYTDTSGRFIICDVKIEEKCITLATLYAPNDDEPTFYQNFFDHLLDFQREDVIIGGDFNLVLDLNKDKKGGRAKTHTESVKVLQIFYGRTQIDGRVENLKSRLISIYLAEEKTRSTL